MACYLSRYNRQIRDNYLIFFDFQDLCRKLSLSKKEIEEFLEDKESVSLILQADYCDFNQDTRTHVPINNVKFIKAVYNHNLENTFNDKLKNFFDNMFYYNNYRSVTKELENAGIVVAYH